MRSSKRDFSQKRAFTLLELLVVVAIIALLVAILVPSMSQARDRAQETVCMANLSQMSRGFFAYATANKDYLCSGSFDPDVSNGRDGPPDKIGWIADLVNSRGGKPAEAMCPTNLARYNQKLVPTSSSTAGAMTITYAQQLVSRAYNSNYTQSWYMARTEMKPTGGNPKKVASTLGPLRTSVMMKVAPARVPLMGDGSIESSDVYQGQQTVRTMTDGPYVPPYGIQDYADFGPAHGFGPIGGTKGNALSERIKANILMADGHIEKFIDKNGSDGQPPRNGRFGINDNDPNNPMGTQEDLSPGRVFDGAITMGRRSRDPYSKQ